MASSFNQGGGIADYFSRVHASVEPLSLMLMQYSTQLQNKTEISNEFYSFLANSLTGILESTNTTTRNMQLGLQQPTKDTFTVLLALNVLNEKQKSEINALREKCTLAESEKQDLIAKINDAQEKYNSLVSNFTQPEMQTQPQFAAGQNANLQRQINELKQQLAESNERIKLQQKRNNDENVELKHTVESQREKIQSFEEELEKYQSAAMKEEKQKQEQLNFLAQALGIDHISDMRSGIDILKQKLGFGDAKGSIVSLVNDKLKENNKKYVQLLGKFNVQESNENVEQGIRSNVENAHNKQIIKELHSEFEFSKTINDISSAVHDIVDNGDGLIPELTRELELHGEVNRVNIVDAIKGKMDEILVFKQENEQLKAENEDLKAKNKTNELLLSLIKTKPVVYEVMPNPQQQQQIEQQQIQVETPEYEEGQVITREIPMDDNASERSNLGHIENIVHDLDEAQRTLVEYDSLLKSNQQRIHDLEKDKEIEVQNAKKEIKQHYRAKIDQLTQVIESLANNEDKLKSLRRKARQIKQQEEEARKQLSETEEKLREETELKEQVQQQYNETVQQLQSYVNENSRLSQELESTRQTIVLSQQEETNTQNIKDTLTDVSEQVVSTAEELAAEAKQRNELVTVVHKQQQVIIELEKLLSEQIAKREEEGDGVIKTRELDQIMQEEGIDEETFTEALSEINTENAKDEVNDLMLIARSDVKGREKAVRAVQLLTTKVNELTGQRDALQDSINNAVDKQPVIDRLVKMLHEQLKFVERIACTNDSAITDDIRNAMLSNAARTNKYLLDHCKGFVEDKSLFDSLGINADPLQLSEALERVFSTYEQFDTNEAQELLVLLRQAIAAALVLQRYSSEAQQQCERNAKEIGIVKNELKLFREEVERKDKETEKRVQKKNQEVEQSKKDAENKISNIENILRANISNPEAAAPIERCLTELDNGAEFEFAEEDYQESIQRELEEHKKALRETQQKLEEKENELNELKETTTREINEIQGVSGELEAETTSIIQSQTKELDHLREELHGCRTEFDSLRAEFENVKQNNAELHSALQQEKKKNAALDQAMRNEVNRVKDRAAAKLDKAMKMLATEQKQRIDKMSQRLRAVQQELKQRNQEVSEKQEIIKKQEEQATQLSLSCSQMEEEIQQNVQGNEQKLQLLRQQLTEQQERVQALELEKKVTLNKLKSSEEKCTKEKTHFESQLAMYKFAAANQMQAKLDQAQTELQDKQYNFLKDVCNTFQEYVDFTVPITPPNVLQMLEQVSADSKKAKRDAEKANDCERQLNEIRNLLQAQKGTRTTAVVSDFVDTSNKQKERIEELENKLNEQVAGQDSTAAEWEEWGRKVYASSSDKAQMPHSSQQLRMALEEMIYAAGNGKSLANKIDILRAQKKLLNSSTDAVEQKSDIEEPKSLVPAICALMFVRRVMKMSHVIPSEFSFKKSSFNENERFSADEEENEGEKEEVHNSITSLFGASVTD